MNKFADLSIGTKLLIFIVPVIIITTSFGSIIIFENHKKALEKEVLEKSRTISTLLIQIGDHKLMSKVAEEFTSFTGYRLKQTSLNPVNSRNAPDNFERRVLEGFREKSSDEYYEIVTGEDGKTYFRYMKALYINEDCLPCHKGYKVGDLRGAISVVAPYDSVKREIKKERLYFFGIIQILLVVGFLSVYFISHKVVREPLNRILKEIKRSSSLIKEGKEIEDLKVEGRDEIGQIAEAFNEMRKNLTESFRERNEAIENFVYSISHDLKAPLRGIEGFAIALKEDYFDKLDEDGKHYLERITANAKKMGVIIDYLLEYSRIGRIALPKEDVDTGEIIKSVLQDLEYQIKEKGAEIILPESFPVIKNAERQRIYQIFVNLISNSLKYNDKEKPRIEVGWKEEGDYYTFYVNDNGIGFDMKYSQKIFQIFQRLHTDDDFEGTGMGLALVKKIIDTYGGEIWAVGKPGEGATFYFKIPKEVKD